MQFEMGFVQETLPKNCRESDSDNLLVSFSGGRTSAYMVKLLREHEYWSKKKHLYVFSNTGMELEETLDFVNRVDLEWGLGVHWIEPVCNEYGIGSTWKLVSFETASRDGSPFESFIRKFGIPSTEAPYCSSELKSIPILKYGRHVFGSRDFDQAIGIRSDEPGRVTRKPGFVYPLVGMNVDLGKVRAFWNANKKLDLKLKSYEGNCNLCFKKSERKLLTTLLEHPERAEWWNRMEVQYSTFLPPTRTTKKPPYLFNRKQRTVKQLLELSKSGTFTPSTDPHYVPDYEMDHEIACQCGHGTETGEDEA